MALISEVEATEDKRKQRNIRLFDSTFDRLVMYAGTHHAGNISDAVEALLITALNTADGQAAIATQERQAEVGEPVLARILKSILADHLDTQRAQLDRIEVNAATGQLLAVDLLRCLYDSPPPCPSCGHQWASAAPFAAAEQEGAIGAAIRAVGMGSIPRMRKG